jgi:hypothetical protein
VGMQRSTGVTRACLVLSAISDAYERDPVRHPGALELCERFRGRIASGQTEAELGEAEALLWDTEQKHERMIANQRLDGYMPRSLDEALAFVCREALDELERLRGQRAAQKKAVPAVRVQA